MRLWTMPVKVIEQYLRAILFVLQYFKHRNCIYVFTLLLDLKGYEF